jgi:hypothetical protein
MATRIPASQRTSLGGCHPTRVQATGTSRHRQGNLGMVPEKVLAAAEAQAAAAAAILRGHKKQVATKALNVYRKRDPVDPLVHQNGAFDQISR